MAIRDVCNAYRFEIKETNSRKYDLNYIILVEKYLKDEEAKLTRGDFQNRPLDQDIINQILSTETSSQNHQLDTSNILIKELSKKDTLPVRFIEMLQYGWQKDGINHNLFERFEVHFDKELAKPEVSSVLFKKALSGIQFSLDELIEGHINLSDKMEELELILKKNTNQLELLGYRILYEGGKCKGFEFIGEKLNRIEDKIDDIPKEVINQIKELIPHLATNLIQSNYINNTNIDNIREVALALAHIQNNNPEEAIRILSK